MARDILHPKLRSWFNNLNINSKMILVYSCCMAVLFSCFAGFLILVSNQITQDTLQEESWRIIEQGNTLIEKQQEYLTGIAEYFCISSDVQHLLRSSNSGLTATPSIELMSALRTRSYILSAVLYDLKGEPIMYMSIDHSSSPVAQPCEEGTVFHDLVSGQLNYRWEFIAQNDTHFMEHDNSPKLCLWHVVEDTQTMLPIGVIAVSLDTRKLLGSDTRPERFYDSLLLINSDGHCAFCSTNNTVQLSAVSCQTLSELVNQTAGNKFGSSIQELDSTRYHIFYSQVASTELCSFLLIPYRPLILEESEITIYAIVGILLCIIMMIPVLLICSAWITKPIKKLTASMEHFMYGNESIRTSIVGKDEIGRMGQIFNQMVHNQQELIENNYKSKIREQAAELDMQQAKVNPHFLYNMLHSIQWIALRKKDMEIANITYAMGHFFRVSLSRGKSVITISQELDLIKYYLYLQNFRFPGLISYTIDCDDSTQNAVVPKFIIQPLLENSIIHGMKSSSSPLHIRLCCQSIPETERLLIVVEDNGKGIDPEILSQLPVLSENPDSQKSGSRFALKNIDARLNLMYGKDYLFSFENCPDGGARVTIETPLRIEPDLPKKED